MNITKKDIIAFNKAIGEQGELNNESSLEFSLHLSKNKKNWLYELSYLVRSILIDHVFRDGNKRTTLLLMVYCLEESNKKYNNKQLMSVITKITKNNIASPVQIARLIYNGLREKN